MSDLMASMTEIILYVGGMAFMLFFFGYMVGGLIKSAIVHIRLKFMKRGEKADKYFRDNIYYW